MSFFMAPPGLFDKIWPNSRMLKEFDNNFKNIENMYFRNLKIKLSRVVWSVSLPRPNSRGHAETVRVNNYFVFQDLRFPYVSLFLKFIAKSFNILGFGQIWSNRPGGAMKNDIYRSAWVRTSSKLRKLAAVKIWDSTDHYPWSHFQINNQLIIARNKISYLRDIHRKTLHRVKNLREHT